MSDDPPLWTATIVATWTPPTIDWGRLIAGVGLAVLLAGTAFRLWLDRGSVAVVVPLAIAAWLGWTSLRAVRRRASPAEMRLTLAPDSLRLSASGANAIAIELARDRAGWLIADEMSTNWHWREVSLTDVAGRQVARFAGSLAAISIASSGEPDAARVPDRLPVAVLLGDWWPHPARRMTRQGGMSVRLRWRDPKVERFPGHERRSRIAWSLLYGAFAALFLGAAFLGDSDVLLRLAWAVAGIALILWRLVVLTWHPRFLASPEAS